MEEHSGNKWKQRAPTSTRPYGSAFCSRNGLQKRMTCHDCHDAQKQKGSVVHFFFRTPFAPFCASFARFRACFAQNSWIIFDHIRRHQVQNVNITHVKADRMQDASLCFQSVYSPTLSCSHATGQRIFAMGFFHG